MSRARDLARRAALSALAGGGLTAVGAGGPLAGGGALAAETGPGTATGTQPTSTTPAPAPEQGAGGATATPTTTTTAQPATPPPGESSAAAGPVPTGSAKQPSGSSHGSGSGGAAHGGRHGPTVVRQHSQPSTGGTAFKPGVPALAVPRPAAPQGPAAVPSSNIAPAPQVAAGQLPPSLLPGSLVSMQALGFYRIPLFLLPIYQAASAQYGVPWPILAAINEVETDYGTDLSVSSAGAVGWMQFMPETWLQYGVDAVNAGYADPYNPVDAIFAAARYLHAAGASGNLTGAIMAYNHSEAYVQSVLLRARLIASYPESVIATLTALTEGSLPASGAQLAAPAPLPGTSSATAKAVPASAGSALAPSAAGSVPGSSPAPSPAASAAAAEQAADAPAPASQLSELVAPASAPVVAVENGRIVGLGRSRRLGNYLVLRDTYGDVFTYASLGSIVPSFRPPKPASLHVAARQASKRTPAARKVQIAQPAAVPAAQSAAAVPAVQSQASGKVRVFAHPGNPDALVALRARGATRPGVSLAPGWTALTRGTLVSQGTVLGHLKASGEASKPGTPTGRTPSAGQASSPSQPTRFGSMRFAIRPAGAQGAVDPGAILENWRQLDAALHPQGAKAGAVLAGATAADAFSLDAGELERAVLSDPNIQLDACDRQQVAAGKVDERSLALLVFLSRSGLGPTVGELSCAAPSYTAAGPVAVYLTGNTFKMTAVNGVAITGNQGAGTVTDAAIRTLLGAKHGFAPSQIVSLMQYPGVPATVARADHGDYIEVQLPARHAHAVHGVAALAAARSAGARNTVAPGAARVTLDAAQWGQLVSRIGALPQPKVARRPSSAAIRDPQSAAGRRSG